MGANQGGRRASSSWQAHAAFVLAALLAGCVTQSGPPLSSMATLGGPPKGMARIVVVRQERGTLSLGDGAFPVKLDGESLGELSTGSFAYLDRPAGPHQLSVDFWGWPGVTRHDFAAAAGRTYYFRARLNDQARAVQAVSYISPLGGLAAAAATFNDRQGPVDLIPISEAEAKQAIVAAEQERRQAEETQTRRASPN
jgi:hypothetical protein